MILRKLYCLFFITFFGLAIRQEVAFGQELLSFSHTAGLYQEPFDLTITSAMPGLEIRYTLNGDEPGAQSMLYTGSVTVAPRPYSEARFMDINTSADPVFHGYYWKGPSGETPMATVVRATAMFWGQPVGEIVTATYFFSDSFPHTMPVFSLSIDSLHLFDHETGIYIPGAAYEAAPSAYTGNYYGRGMDWERPVHIEIFDTTGIPLLVQEAGIRIHGGLSRIFPFKSLRLYARASYSHPTFDYPFFDQRPHESYNHLLLRNSGQDFIYTMFNDAWASAIGWDMNFEAQAWKPVIVYINGEYWGIHNLRERIHENYIERLTGIHRDNIDLVDLLTHHFGDEQHEGYGELFNFFEEHDLTQESSYAQFKEMVDFDNFLDYYVFKIYMGAYDWPSNNVRIWRQAEPAGKWRWISFDNDDVGWNYQYDIIANLLDSVSNSWPVFQWGNLSFRKLIKNKSFKEALLNRLAWHMETTFRTSRMDSILMEFYHTYAPEIGTHIIRHQWPEAEWFWYSRVAVLKQFNELRCQFVKDMILEHFQVKLDVACDFSSTNPEPEMNIVLFPNPASNTVNFEHEFGTMFNVAAIFDMLGREVYRITLDRYSVQHTLQVGHLQQGNYIVLLMSESETPRSARLVIKH